MFLKRGREGEKDYREMGGRKSPSLLSFLFPAVGFVLTGTHSTQKIYDSPSIGTGNS